MSPSIILKTEDIERKKMPAAKDLLPCDFCPGQGMNVCRRLERNRLIELLATSRRHRWNKGELLYGAGDRAKFVYKITSGVVALSQLLPDGRRQIVSFLLAGDICGSSDPVERFDLTAIALSNVETCSFERDAFAAFLSRHRDVSEESRETMQEKIRTLTRHTTVLGRMTAGEKLAYFLLEFAAACAKRGIDTRPMRLPMTRNDIADHLGLTFETVSRTFGELRNLHLIRTVNHVDVLILDRQRLENLANTVG